MSHQPPVNDLPITECLPEIISAVSACRPVVLKAPPGAGKTTGVPPALLAAGVAGEGSMIVVQPRRLAARSAAARLADLLATKLGQQVGYHVRFDRCASRATRLLVTTTGMLLRRLQDDPLLEHVSCVLLDEFHERSIDVDLALGMLQRVRSTLRPELRLVVMSATLDPQPITEFLGDQAVSVESAGRSHPVEIQYRAGTTYQRLEQQIADALPDVLQSTAGDVLVFLPGVGEIRRTARVIGGFQSDQCDVFQLYGEMPLKAQNQVLQATSNRKIILATNVAETSITIPGVTAVIDSGLARVMRFDATVGLPKLQLEPISQASADQRTGRAGRTQPGICLRLWAAASHRGRRARDTAEILRGDFSPAALALAAWGERDVFDFPWLTPPTQASVEQATELLENLGALADDRSLTDLGQQMSQLPIHPRLARFMLAAADWGVVREASIAAALLTERDPFRGGPQVARDSAAAAGLWERTADLIECFDSDHRPASDPNLLRQIRRVAKQLERCIDPSGTDITTNQNEPVSQRLAKALLSAYPDRVARRREESKQRGLMVGGRGVRLANGESIGDASLFVCVDVDSRDQEALVRTACAVQRDWLDASHIRVEDQFIYHTQSDAIVCRRTQYFVDLPLESQPIPCQPNPDVARLLAETVGKNVAGALPVDNVQVNQFIERVRFLNQSMPELELPPLDDESLQSVVQQLCQSRTSLRQLRQAPWLDHLRGRYSFEQLRLIDQHAPERMEVPSGNRMSVQYACGKPPTMEVRIQELFGWRENPRIAGGKVPIRLHLLGPNHRAQQITEDLSSFWQTTYVQVRKELRRRYPKHHWPEDPLGAIATRNGLQPRRQR